MVLLSVGLQYFDGIGDSIEVTETSHEQLVAVQWHDFEAYQCIFIGSKAGAAIWLLCVTFLGERNAFLSIKAIPMCRTANLFDLSSELCNKSMPMSNYPLPAAVRDEMCKA